ncbi:MAG: hypothetical protein JRI25_00630 [Deltaproteobacteria bacterium]|nr:hypothetical protein [Deltaproteobacteria bacterium]MBW2253082.1 hypothetical protein [Deltaproteobacteria bacterium]
MPDLLTLMELEANARAVLEQVMTAGIAGASALVAKQLLCPHDEDYEKAFLPEMADVLQRAYAPFWATSQMAPRPKAGQTQVLIYLATTEDLQANNARARQFPGGYKEVAPYLAADRLWVRWKFVKPGETLGMAFDGMVWLDDHWAWFPKPWRAVRMAQTLPPSIPEA